MKYNLQSTKVEVRSRESEDRRRELFCYWLLMLVIWGFVHSTRANSRLETADWRDLGFTKYEGRSAKVILLLVISDLKVVLFAGFSDPILFTIYELLFLELCVRDLLIQFPPFRVGVKKLNETDLIYEVRF